MSGSGSGSSSSGHPFPRPSSRTGRARCQSTVGASDSPPAPSGRERLAINFLTSGGPPQPRFPPLQQGYTRVRSTSTADVSQARRHFVPTPSHLNPGQPRVATASGSAEDSGRFVDLYIIRLLFIDLLLGHITLKSYSIQRLELNLARQHCPVYLSRLH